MKICEQLFTTEPIVKEKHFLDEKTMLNNSEFNIKPEELIDKCKVGSRWPL